MEFIEHLGPEDLQAIQAKEQPVTSADTLATTSLYERKEDPAAAARARFERLVDHVRDGEAEKGREIPRSVIRERIQSALLHGTITMNVSPTNHIASHSFTARPHSAEEKVFGSIIPRAPRSLSRA